MGREVAGVPVSRMARRAFCRKGLEPSVRAVCTKLGVKGFMRLSNLERDARAQGSCRHHCSWATLHHCLCHCQRLAGRIKPW